MEAVEERLRGWSRAMASRSPRTPARRSRPGASGCGRCWSCSAPGRAPARRRSGRRRRSSSFTWRRSSTTTCSTRRRCAAAGPTVAARLGPRARAGRRRPAVLARLRPARQRRRAAPGRAPVAGPRSRSPAASWPSGTTPSTSRSPAERYLERCRLKTARLFECACLIGQRRGAERRGWMPCARSDARSASPSSCSTTCSTSPVRRSGPARPAAPTCWTAPSPCR